jgi:hypothetical protein
MVLVRCGGDNYIATPTFDERSISSLQSNGVKSALKMDAVRAVMRIATNRTVNDESSSPRN